MKSIGGMVKTANRVACGIGACAIFGVFIILFLLHSPVSVDKSFTVVEGSSVYQISMLLKENKLIRSALLFRLYTHITITQGALKAGTFIIPKGAGLLAIHKLLLRSPRAQTIRVVLPEGYTARQMAERLARNEVVSADAFMQIVHDADALRRVGLPATVQSAEGFLFPDTYFFVRNMSAMAVLQKLVGQFFAVMNELNLSLENGVHGLSWYETIIVASIVEREYVERDDASLIASVFYNRLEKNMRLESCATVVYVMTEIEGLPHPSRVLYTDLERRSPYNTYRHKGLPPHPISNMGRIALAAAFEPSNTNYLFFVVKPGSTQHIFTTTFDQHNQAARLYVKQVFGK